MVQVRLHTGTTPTTTHGRNVAPTAQAQANVTGKCNNPPDSKPKSKEQIHTIMRKKHYPRLPYVLAYGFKKVYE